VFPKTATLFIPRFFNVSSDALLGDALFSRNEWACTIQTVSFLRRRKW
jgi:hypothetical protein